jgi:hypothetical protein
VLPQWPGLMVMTAPGLGVPLVLGRAMTYGASSIAAVCSLAIVARPAALVAVTTTRMRRPASSLTDT